MSRKLDNPVRLVLVVVATALVTAAAVTAQQRQAGAQTWDQMAATDGVAVMPVQLAGGGGFLLVNSGTQTFCLYQYDQRRQPHERLVLLAARRFDADCQLEDLNNAEPRPAVIRELVQQTAPPASTPRATTEKTDTAPGATTGPATNGK